MHGSQIVFTHGLLIVICYDFPVTQYNPICLLLAVARTTNIEAIL